MLDVLMMAFMVLGFTAASSIAVTLFLIASGRIK